MDSTAVWPPSPIVKISFFSKKSHHFSEKNPNFIRFEKFHYFNRILRQICYILVIKKFHGQRSEPSNIGHLQHRTSSIGKTVKQKV